MDCTNIPGSDCTDSCPEDWREHGHHCYYWNKIYEKWSDAEKFCNTKDGNLASVENEETTKFLNSWKAEEYWLGGTDEGTEGVWRWTDGSPWNYTNWRPGQPANISKVLGDEENCLTVSNKMGQKWSDKNCYPTFYTKRSFCIRPLCSGRPGSLCLL